MHEILEHGWGVNKALGYHQVFVMSSRCYERRLPFVFLSDPNQIVCAVEIQLGKNGGLSETF